MINNIPYAFIPEQKPLVDYTVAEKNSHSSIFNLPMNYGKHNELVLFDDIVRFNGATFPRNALAYVNWFQVHTQAKSMVKALNVRLKIASQMLVGALPRQQSGVPEDPKFYEGDARVLAVMDTSFTLYDDEEEGNWTVFDFQKLVMDLKDHREWLLKNSKKIPGLMKEAKKVPLVPNNYQYKSLRNAVQPSTHPFFKKKVLRLSAILVSLETFNSFAETLNGFGWGYKLKTTTGVPMVSDVALDLYEHLTSLINSLEHLCINDVSIEKELGDIQDVFKREKENLEMGKRCLADYMEKNPSATSQPSFPFPNAVVMSVPTQSNVEKAEGFLSKHLQNNINGLKSGLMTASDTLPTVESKKPSLNPSQKDAIVKEGMALLKDAEKAAGEMIATPAPKLTPVKTVKKAKTPVKVPNTKTKTAIQEGRKLQALKEAKKILTTTKTRKVAK